MTCPLCERDVDLTKHHLRTKKGGPETADVCRECQQVIHGLYSNREIRRRTDLHTIEGLRKDRRVRRALSFVRKIPPGGNMRMRQRAGRR